MYKNRIRDLRRKKQISRAQLAAIVGIKEPQLHAIEAGVSPARFNVAAKICAALDEGMQIVFPQTKKSLLKLHKDGKDIEDLFRDGAYIEPFAEAGIDMAPEIWILQLRPRHGAKRQYQISGIEKRRLWSLFQDGDRDEFIVFDTDETRVAINAQHDSGASPGADFTNATLIGAQFAHAYLEAESLRNAINVPPVSSQIDISH